MADKPKQVLISYARADYDELVRAGISDLCDEIAKAIRASLGTSSEIVLQADADFFDWDSLHRVKYAQSDNCFLIPLLAPFFFESTECLDETFDFLNLEIRSGRRDLVFPVYLRHTEKLEDEKQRDRNIVAQALYEHDPADWREVIKDAYDVKRIQQLALELAERIKVTSERIVSDAPPDIPEQGPGVRFRINEDGLIDRAPDEPHDADENEARLNSLKAGLIEACDRLLGSSGHNTLGFVLDTIRAYRGSIDRPLVDVQYTDIWRHGQRLQNLADAATREVDRLEPSLEDDQHAALNDLLNLHGPFMLSTEEGRALQAMADRYQATREEQERQKAAVQAFKKAIEDSTDLATDAVKQVIAEASDEFGKGRYPERTAIISETTNRNFLSTAGKAAAYVGNHAAGGIIGGVAVGTALGSGLVGASIEALNAAGQASTQFILSHQMMLKGLVACSTDSLAWLNHLIGWLRRKQANQPKKRRIVEVGLAAEFDKAEPLASDNLWTPGRIFRDIDESWCPEMVVIPAGEFLMGSPDDENGRFDSESPLHPVTIAKPYSLGRCPITFEAFDHFCEATSRDRPDDKGWGREQRPVINVSWDHATAYCAWLSNKTGCWYRLPSESEWEYACRAKSEVAYTFGETIDKKKANYDHNVGKTTKVGIYPANAFNLFDMHGNVWEWCEDHYKASYDYAPTDGRPRLFPNARSRVVRGGAWNYDSRMVRSASRYASEPGNRRLNLGFRCIRVLE